MITISDDAARELEALHPPMALLLDVSPRGCGAPAVSFAPLQETTSPTTPLAQYGSVTLHASPDLLKKTGGMTLNCTNGRFSVETSLPFTVSGCGTCPASPLLGGTCGIIDGMNF